MIVTTCFDMTDLRYKFMCSIIRKLRELDEIRKNNMWKYMFSTIHCTVGVMLMVLYPSTMYFFLGVMLISGGNCANMMIVSDLEKQCKDLKEQFKRLK